MTGLPSGSRAGQAPGRRRRRPRGESGRPARRAVPGPRTGRSGRASVGVSRHGGRLWSSLFLLVFIPFVRTDLQSETEGATILVLSGTLPRQPVLRTLDPNNEPHMTLHLRLSGWSSRFANRCAAKWSKPPRPARRAFSRSRKCGVTPIECRSWMWSSTRAGEMLRDDAANEPPRKMSPPGRRGAPLGSVSRVGARAVVDSPAGSAPVGSVEDGSCSHRSPECEPVSGALRPASLVRGIGLSGLLACLPPPR